MGQQDVFIFEWKCLLLYTPEQGKERFAEKIVSFKKY